ncbi:MAG: Ribosomal protein S19 [Parcubacteria group bacterium GW2011_GWA2_44_12]|nr:MAG: Ribosomal protein S19 [Parcubacteria group bacterium GW2011_GWA2_44_12]
MSRSLKKGPFVDPRVLKKVAGKLPSQVVQPILIWSRSCTIVPEMVGFTFGVHNGRKHINVSVVEEMVGHRFGEFALTRIFFRHGGKMQRELEKKVQGAEKTKVVSAQAKAKK